jgi:hypothetical protein
MPPLAPFKPPRESHASGLSITIACKSLYHQSRTKILAASLAYLEWTDSFDQQIFDVVEKEELERSLCHLQIVRERVWRDTVDEDRTVL